MLLSAMVFALQQLHVKRVARVVVAWEEAGQTDFHYETDYYPIPEQARRQVVLVVVNIYSLLLTTIRIP
jgi:hypothetical protein